MSDLENAARRLRDSVAALPEYARREDRWHVDVHHGRVDVLSGDPDTAFVTHQIAYIGASAAPAHRPTADHIALTASPPTVALVADLLEAIDGALIYDDGQVRTAAHALASAILNDQERS